MRTVNITLINVIQTEKRVAMLAVMPDGYNKALTITPAKAAKALSQLYTRGYVNARPTTVTLDDQGHVIDWSVNAED